MSKKIMVIDDSPETVELLGHWLQDHQFEVIKAYNGKEALEKAKAVQPDLIISDIVMPEMDGFALLKELKKDAELSSKPILIMSVREKMEDTFRVLGVDDFVIKPSDSNDLIGKVNNSLRKLVSGLETEYVDKAKSEPAASPAPITDASPIPAPEKKQPQPVKKRKVYKVILSGQSSIVTSISKQLKENNCEPIIIENADDIVHHAIDIAPDLFILDTELKGYPTQKIIRQLRNLKPFKTIPIFVYQYLDKEGLTKSSLLQKKMNLDRSRTACREAGATESIGEYDEVELFYTIKKYIQ